MSGDIVGQKDTVFTCNCVILDIILKFDRAKIVLKYTFSLFFPSFYRRIHFHAFPSILRVKIGFGAKFEFRRKFRQTTPVSPDKGRNRKIRDDTGAD